MIMPHEPERTTRTRVVIGAVTALVCALILISIGGVIIQEMANYSPPKEFEVVDKAYMKGGWFTGSDQYRLYYNHDMMYGYILVNQTTFDNYQIGDWYNETYQMILYNAETPWGITDKPTHDPANPLVRLQP